MESPTRAGRMKRKLSNDQEREDESDRPSAGMKRPRDGSLDRPPSLSDAPGTLDADRKEAGGSPVSLKAKDDEIIAKISPTLQPVSRDDDGVHAMTIDPKAPVLKRKHSAVDTEDDGAERPTGIPRREDETIKEEQPVQEGTHIPMDEAPDLTPSATEPPAKPVDALAQSVALDAPAEKPISKPFVNGFAAWKQGGLGGFTPYSFGSASPDSPSAFGGAAPQKPSSAITTGFGGTPTDSTVVNSSANAFASFTSPTPPAASLNPLAGKITSSKNGFEGFAARNPLSFLAKSPVGENIDTLPKIDAFKGLTEGVTPRSFGGTTSSASNGSRDIFGQSRPSLFQENALAPALNVLGASTAPALGASTDPFTYVPEKEEDVFGRKRSGTPQAEQPTVKGDRSVGEGEEDEDMMLRERAVLYYVTKEGSYQKRGVGWVKLNIGRTDRKARLIMRTDGTLKDKASSLDTLTARNTYFMA
ncbi:hypothetical protein CALCODRAFT_52490 [Calocera cornea HHB12733]|uniref:RanBD1 domain-containing protein n=1 Tax=Calocera cornea HHB12733 TaxID=1353952 RepID=A0A165DRZ2_9BASI|nr:hypothetical protein CALCODRAFT_52490 [Calocera cornea HHB12733]